MKSLRSTGTHPVAGHLQLLLVALIVSIACVFVLFQATGRNAHLSTQALSQEIRLQGEETVVLSASVGAQQATGPPYRFPKLIHQTVADKNRVSCQQKKVIQSWKDLNPGYTHKLWDDAAMQEFMLQYYPDLVPIPYDKFLSGTERADLWRILVLHQFGGVYADLDVEALRPIDEWNADHGHDAAVLLGTENYNKSNEHPLHVVNWVVAAMPGHPLLGSMPAIVAKSTMQQFFAAAARPNAVLQQNWYEAGIIDRTGPAALSWAMYDYFKSVGYDAANITYDSVTSADGLLVGGVRVLPIVSLASGWEVAEARKKGHNLTCADVAREKPAALVCHMFWGTWRAKWAFGQLQTYDNC